MIVLTSAECADLERYLADRGHDAGREVFDRIAWHTIPRRARVRLRVKSALGRG